MSEIRRSIVIDRPVAVVWSVFEDVRRLPEISKSTRSVTGAPPALTEVGQTFRQVVALLGRRFESEWVVTAVTPGRSLTISGDVGYGVGYELTESVAPLGADRTEASLHVRYTLPFGVLGRLASRLGVEQRAQVEAAEVLAGLKALVEREFPAG